MERGDLACAALFFFRKVFFTVFPFTKRVRPGGAGGRWSLPPSLPHWPSYGRGRKQGKMGNRGRRNRKEDDLWEPQPRRRRILYFLPSRLPPPPVRTGRNSSPGFPFQEEKKACRQQRGKEAKRRCKQWRGGRKEGVCVQYAKGVNAVSKREKNAALARPYFTSVLLGNNFLSSLSHLRPVDGPDLDLVL